MEQALAAGDTNVVQLLTGCQRRADANAGTPDADRRFMLDNAGYVYRREQAHPSFGLIGATAIVAPQALSSDRRSTGAYRDRSGIVARTGRISSAHTVISSSVSLP